MVEPFLRCNSLNMVYAERGLGKTWFALSLALSVAKGEPFLAYPMPKPRPVLYVDGEMPLADIQERLRALDADPPDTLMVLPSELLFKEARPLNLHNERDQKAIEKGIAALAAQGRKPEVLISDNLSSLSGGVDENDNSVLDKLLQWLVGLRHQGMTVLLVHHAGKSGTQRGASRREDFLDTSIALLRPAEDAEVHAGAHVILTFVKTRDRTPKPPMLELKLSENRGQMDWLYDGYWQVDRGTEILKLIWERRPKNQKDLAAMANVSAGAISQQMKRLRARGYFEDVDALTLNREARERLLEVWPELYGEMVKQGERPLPDDGVI